MQPGDKKSQTSCHEEPTEFILTNGIVMDTNGIVIDTNHSATNDTSSAAANHEASSSSSDVVATSVTMQSVTADSSHHSNDSVVTIHSHDSNHVLSSNSAALKLEGDPQTQNQMDVLWQQLETAMLNNSEKVRDRLEIYGIGEGDEDSESEEGQIWRMVQGDSPYTLELV